MQWQQRLRRRQQRFGRINVRSREAVVAQVRVGTGTNEGYDVQQKEQSYDRRRYSSSSNTNTTSIKSSFSCRTASTGIRSGRVGLGGTTAYETQIDSHPVQEGQELLYAVTYESVLQAKNSDDDGSQEAAIPEAVPEERRFGFRERVFLVVEL